MINFFNQHSLVQGDYNLKDIKVQEEIGRGNSHVYTAFIKDDLYALKQIQIKNDYQYQSFLKQVSYMKQLSGISPDLIKYYGYFVTTQEINQYSKRKFAHIIMQCAEMNLQNLMTCKVSEGKRFSKNQIIKIIDFLLFAFAHLQKNKIAHCDIKPENILILSSKSLTMKLCDVGSCKIVDSDSIEEATILGTVPFLAPQLVKVKTNKIISSNVFKSDVFSFGLVALYLITNKKFSSKQRIQIVQPAYFQVISQWIKQARQIVNYDSRITQILKMALQFQQYKRPLFRDVCNVYQIEKKRKKTALQAKIKKLEDEENEKKSKIQQNFSSIRTQKISLFKTRNMASKISTRTTSIGFPKITRNYERNISPHQLSPMLSPLTKRQSSCFTNLSPERMNTSTLDYKKIIYVTQQDKQAIPFDYLTQEEKNFVLFTNCGYIKKGDCISIYQPCSLASIYQLSEVQANKLYIEYQGFQGVGVGDDCPTLKIKKIYANLRNADLIGGFKYLFKSFCSPELQYIEIDITGADAIFHFSEVLDLLDRLNGKNLKYFGLIWENNLMTHQQHTQIIQKISKLIIKKLMLVMNQNFINYQKEFRWALPKNCEILYLEYKSNFMGKMISNLSVSILHCSIKQLYLNFSNNNLNKSQSNMLFKSVSTIETLQKLVINLSWNLIEDISYIITSLANLKQITSLEIKLYHAGIPQQQIFQAISEIKYLFDNTLKIFKIGYDRSMRKQVFVSKIQTALDEFKNLKIDVVGYDNKYMMAFIKKTNRGAKSKALTTKIKGEKTNLIGFKPMDEKQQKTKQKSGCCISLYSNHINYDNYVCLACSDFSELSKTQYFCKFCIENCKHKGHNIVKIYERAKCCCAYSGYCSSDIAKRICAEQLKIKSKKAYECLRCEKKLCQGCVTRCFDYHKNWVQQCKDAFIFQCGSCF